MGVVGGLMMMVCVWGGGTCPAAHRLPAVVVSSKCGGVGGVGWGVGQVMIGGGGARSRVPALVSSTFLLLLLSTVLAWVGVDDESWVGGADESWVGGDDESWMGGDDESWMGGDDESWGVMMRWCGVVRVGSKPPRCHPACCYC